MEDPELFELLESELGLLINKAHKSGVSYWHILRVILSHIENLVIQADVEYHIKGGN